MTEGHHLTADVSSLLHPLHYDGPWPEAMNNPLDYEPHAICRQAVQEALPLVDDLMRGRDEGKMFGVLVVRTPAAGGRVGQAGFLLAFSGQVGDSASWPGFVPAVFDYLRPDGYFKSEEARISDINHRLEMLLADEAYTRLLREETLLNEEAEEAVERALTTMRMAKRLRDERRKEGFLSADDQAAMLRESQFLKAEVHRTRQRYSARQAELAAKLQPYRQAVEAMKTERHQRSDALQRWLFGQFRMLNYRGETRDLLQLFAAATGSVPPAGSGECCEPKLLQYAFAHRLQPVQMAMFWYGPSPRDEVRHHLQYYPACRGKCKPILTWMLGLTDAPPQTSTRVKPTALNAADILVTATDRYVVVDKPAGLLSVPGLTGEPSVLSVLEDTLGPLFVVHRLDQDTSGLLVVARDKDTQRQLRQQFEQRQVEKVYVAELQRPTLTAGQEGRISLPLAADLLNRPCQRVDHEQGKEAVTLWKALSATRVELRPLTGRTHQLRVHCAHHDGLDNPIRGDRLYGTPADRLYLHAAFLSFVDPATGVRVSYSSRPADWAASDSC